MLKARLNDGSSLLDYLCNQPRWFFKGLPFEDGKQMRQYFLDKESGMSQAYLWIQFPKPDILSLPEEFLDKILGLERFIWFKKYLFNIEFNPHIHSHLIILEPAKSVRPARVIENISKHLGIEKNHVECKRYTHSLQNRINYVKGLKIPQHKQMLVKQDIADREKYNLSTYYSDGTEVFSKSETEEFKKEESDEEYERTPTGEADSDAF